MSRRRPNRGRARSRRSGFTLMEVLLVMAILVILGAIGFFAFSDTLFNANRRAAKVQIDGFKTPIQQFLLDEHRYPNSLDELWTPQGQTARVYMDKAVPQDPWGHDWQYQAPDMGQPGGKVYISSAGPNGSPGDADDVTSEQ